MVNFIICFFFWQAPIRWFEPEAYKANVAAGGIVTLLPVSEVDNDLEWK